MREIGHIVAEGEGAAVYFDNGRYFPIFSGNIFDDEAESGEVRGKSYSSLEELIADIPYGAVFRKPGDTSMPKYLIDRINEIRAKSGGPLIPPEGIGGSASAESIQNSTEVDKM